jgi:membrane protease YdiL (CAAX protease family)
LSVRVPNKPLPTFLVLLCIFSAAAYALVVHSHHETAALSRFLMWSPGFAALSTCLLLRIPLGTLGWRWPATRFLTLAYFLPLLYATPVYLLTWLTIRDAFALTGFEATMAGMYGLAASPILGTFGVAFPLLLTITVIGTATWALGEELGWRGFLFPRLRERFGFHGACLISGVLWAVWHYPGLLWADYNAGTNPVFAIGCFTVSVISMAYIMGYLRTYSGSIWPCVLLHATHNTFVQGLFDPLTANVGWAKYITTEFGAVLAAAEVGAAIIVISIGHHGEGLQMTGVAVPRDNAKA